MRERVRARRTRQHQLPAHTIEPEGGSASSSDCARAASLSAATAGHDFSQIAIHPAQTKPAVSRPGDRHEREAERIADQVAGTSASTNKAASITSGTSSTPPAVSRRAAPSAPSGLASKAAVAALRSTGEPLEPGARAFMESRFGHDFSTVRIHAGEQAAAAAHSVSATAFTLGRDIVFGAGQYAPQTTEGRHLIAHELAHVVQQSVSGPASGGAIQRSIDTALSAVGVAQAAYGRSDQGLEWSSDQAQYPAEMTHVPPGAKEVDKPVALFSSRGAYIDNETQLNLRGEFGDKAMRNVRIELVRTTSYAHSFLSFKAGALTTAYGTPDDPRIRFVCSGRFDPVGFGDCTFNVLLEVDQHGNATALKLETPESSFGGAGIHLNAAGQNGFELIIGFRAGSTIGEAFQDAKSAAGKAGERLKSFKLPW